MDGWAPSAKEAAAVGLINECVSPEDLLEAADAQLRSRLANPDYVKNHRGYADTAELLHVNDRESKDAADVPGRPVPAGPGRTSSRRRARGSRLLLVFEAPSRRGPRGALL